jgi:hypothetical protein
MPLDFQIKQAAFQFGVDESTDPHALPLGVLTRLENFVWLKAARIEKRAGVSALATGVVSGGVLPAVTRLFTRGNELCAATNSGLYALSAVGWSLVGALPDASLAWETSHDSQQGVRGACVGYGNGCIVQAWIDGDPFNAPAGVTKGNLTVEVLDATTRLRALQVAITTNSLTESVRVLVSGTNAFVVYKQGTTIFAYAIDLNTRTAVGLSILRNDARVSGLVSMGVDACIIGTKLVICYETGAGVLSLFSYTYAAGVFTQSATNTIAEPSTIIGPISIDGALGESLYVGYAVQLPANKTRCAVVDATTFATTAAPFDVDNTTNASWVSVARFDAGSCVYMNCTTDVATQKITSAGVISATRRTLSSLPLSRPFVVNGKCYMYITDTSVTPTPVSAFAGANTVLVEVSTIVSGLGGFLPHRYVGAVDILTGGAFRIGIVSNVAKPTATTPIVVLPYLSDATPNVNNWRCGIRTVRAGFGADLAADHWRNVTIGHEAYFCGGALSAYDGRSVFDYGFLRAPIIYQTATAAVGAKVGAGTYLYSLVQEQRSHAGVLHRSPATAPITITIGVSSTVTLSVLGFSVGNKQNDGTGYGSPINDSPTTLPVYRTVAAGSIPQRLTYEPSFNTLVCDPRTNAVFVDGSPDTNIGNGVTLAARPALYTASALDDFQPPASLSMFYHADRLWTLSGDGVTWSYSKTFQDDLGAAPGFHPNFRTVFADQQTCGISMDEKAIFFSPIGIKYMLGLGPAKDGSNSDFSTPIRINTDAGCANPRSVVSTPDGIMFLSTVGIYTLTRGLDLAWSGKEIQDDLALYPNITSAILVAAKSEVRFTANAADGLSGVVLVYNYVQKQWSISKYLQNSAGVGVAIADACMYQGLWTFVTPAGQVYQEGSTSLDAGAYVPGVLETAWISAAGPIAFTAVSDFWLQGVSNSDHELLIEAAFDSNTTYLQNRLFRAGSQVTTPGPLEECKINIGNRRMCDSIRFRVTDSAPLTPGSVLGTGKGPSFSSLGIQVGLLKGGSEAAGKKG